MYALTYMLSSETRWLFCLGGHDIRGIAKDNSIPTVSLTASIQLTLPFLYRGCAVTACTRDILAKSENAEVQEDIVGSSGISPRSIAAFTHMGFAPSPSLLTPPQDRLPTMTFLVDIIDFLRKD